MFNLRYLTKAIGCMHFLLIYRRNKPGMLGEHEKSLEITTNIYYIVIFAFIKQL